MKIQNLIAIGLMAAFATMAQAQSYYGGGYNAPAGLRENRYSSEREERFDERRDIGRDLRVRENLMRRIEADRRAVEHERWELRNASWYSAGHEFRELCAAQERLERDYRELHMTDRDVNHDIRRYNRY